MNFNFKDIQRKLSDHKRLLAIVAAGCLGVSTYQSFHLSEYSDKKQECSEAMTSFSGLATEWETSPGLMRQHAQLLSAYLNLALEADTPAQRREYVMLAVANGNALAKFGVGDVDTKNAIEFPDVNQRLDMKYMASIQDKLKNISLVWQKDFNSYSDKTILDWNRKLKDCPDAYGQVAAQTASILFLNIVAILLIGLKEFWFDD